MKDILETKEKAKHFSEISQELKKKMAEIIKPARELGQREVKSKELQAIKEKIDEIDVELKNLAVQTRDLDGQTRDHQAISDSMNRQNQDEKERLAQKLVTNLNSDLSGLEQ